MKSRLFRWHGLLFHALICTTLSGATGQGLFKPVTPKPARFVHAHRVWCNYGTRMGDFTGMTVNAYLQARGLLGGTMAGEVQLRDGEGNPVRAVFGAPKQLITEEGVFRAASSDRIRYEMANWNPFHIFVPYNALALPAGRSHRLTVTFRASCAGLSSTAETEIVLPPGPGSAPPRSLQIIRVERRGNILPDLAVPDFVPPDPSGVGFDIRQHTSAESEPLPLMIVADMQVERLQGETLTAEVRLRHPNGRPVKAAKDAPPKHRDAEGNLISRFRDRILDNSFRWSSAEFPIPYSALGLLPGKKHTLVLTLSATAGGLTSTMEQDFVLQSIKLIGEEAPEPVPPVEEPQTAIEDVPLPQEQEQIRPPSEPPPTGGPDKNKELLSAVDGGDEGAVRSLLDAGADVRARGAGGRTPLHIAAAKGNKRIAEMLISASASPPKTTEPKPEREPPKSAEEKGPKGLFEFDPEYLESLSFDRFQERTQDYVNLKEEGGLTALHLAAQGGHYDVADLLIAFNAEVNVADSEGMTPLHAAAKAGDDAIVALLLLKGADPKASDKEGSTPLDVTTSDSIKSRLKRAIERLPE